MVDIAEDFIVKFHSFEGTTIAQRKKHFFTLLHHNASLKSNAQVLDAIAANLVPKTFLESLFRLELLIYYRRGQELQQLLKEGNDVFVSKIVKQNWFFQESFNEVGADQLVNEILPTMSYSVRKKVLKKLSKFLNSEQFDEIFDAVVATYGIFLAQQYIAGCSAAKIRQILLDYPIKLTTPQLILLYKKDASLIEYYFEKTVNSIDNYVYKHFIRFLYCENQALFHTLQKKYNFTMKFGHRLTKRFVGVQKDAIIQKPMEFNYLKMKTVIRKLGKSSVNLFCNTLPPVIARINRHIIFNDFPKKHHYTLYVKVFENYYKTTYAQHPELIDEFLLKLTSDKAERAALAKIKVDEGEDDYIKYLTTQDSIPLIKEKINLTSDIYERGKLIKYLIETCRINDDVEALAQVMKYFCIRHKNDELNVHMQFIHKIENLFGFKIFTEEMWNCFNDLLTIHMLKFDELATYEKIQTLPLIKFNKGTSNYQKLSYLYFLFRKKQSIDELLTEYYNDDSSEFPQWGKYSKDFEKYYLLFVINTCSGKELTTERIEYNCGLLKRIDGWNKCYKDDQISFYDFPVLVQSFDYMIRNTDVYMDSHVKHIVRSKIFTTTSNNFRDTYLQVYWDRFSTFYNQKDFDWFIKYDPLILVNNFHRFVDEVIDTDTPASFQLRMWHKVKKYSHLQLDENSVQFCLSQLNDENCPNFKPKYVVCLSCVMKPEDFMVVANLYKPANKAVNIKDETQVKLYNLQCSIAQNFKNTKSYDVLPSLLDYCAGDYFKYSLRSLYSILYRTPENLLLRYLNHLATKAVSVRKHALYLTCELSTVTRVENILKLLSKTEGVQSLQKHMFTTTIQYFIKNPADNFFEMVKSNMLNISKSDEESLDCIVERTSEVPEKYRCAYIQYSWEYLEKVVDVWTKLYRLKNNLLHYMNNEIKKQLPLDFVSGILKQHFLVDEKKRLNFNDMVSFGFYLLSCREEKTVILETILNLVDQRADSKVAFQFFNDWRSKIMESEQKNLNYLEPFVKYFESKFNVVDNFRVYVKIFFLKIKIFNNEDLCTRIFTFYDNLVSSYGPHIIPLFSNEFASIIGYFTDNTVISKYYYYHKLIIDHPVPIVAILILNVISEPNKNYKSDVALFNQILHVIKGMPDLGVQINLRTKFSHKLSKTDNVGDKSLVMEVDITYSDDD